jgi:hypothetical protein
MKTFEVVLTKSYIVRINAENKTKAKEYSTFFTGDVQNLSSLNDEQYYNFKIENIDCKTNEALGVVELNEEN